MSRYTMGRILQEMANLDTVAVRRIEGNRPVWRFNGIACGPIIKTLIKRGWVWAHYPHNEGWAGISEAGRAEYDRLTLL